MYHKGFDGGWGGGEKSKNYTNAASMVLAHRSCSEFWVLFWLLALLVLSPGSWPLSCAVFRAPAWCVLPTCLLSPAPLLFVPPCKPEPTTATLVPSAAPQAFGELNGVGAMGVASGARPPDFQSLLGVIVVWCPRASLSSPVKWG